MTSKAVKVCRVRALLTSMTLGTFSPGPILGSQIDTSKISVPSGPGSIEGMGESFEPQLNTGTFVFGLPFKLTKLRGAVTPALALNYNSGGGNGSVGVGWTFQTPSVQRQTDKGLPSYTAADTFVDSTGEELVRLADGTFRAENEASFMQWENLEAAGWKATQPDGTVLRFGHTVQARLDRPVNLGGGTFKWMLESAEDTNGNRVLYRYAKDRDQIYLSEVEWGAHASAPSQSLVLSLAYEASRPDPVVDYRGRFHSETRWRLDSVTMKHGPRRLRHWKLEYKAGVPVSLLERVRMYGDERANTGAGAQKNTDFMPPLEMSYSPSSLGLDARVTDVGPFYNARFQEREGDLVDLNQDGLPDLLVSREGSPGQTTYYSRLNRGAGRDFAPEAIITSQVFLPKLNESGVRLSDFRGDAKVKLLIPESDGGGTRFYYRDFTSLTTLGAAVTYQPPGDFDLADAQVQLMDVNNDRALDLIAPDAGRFSYVLSSPSGGVPVFGQGPPDAEITESFSFGDQWQLADMNGDRIADLVQIVLSRFSRDGVAYRPGYGYGAFATAIVLAGGPLEQELSSRGAAGLSLVDIDLDGLADLVSVDYSEVRIWRNDGGQGLATQPVVITEGVPDWSEGSTSVRFADMNGNGSTDIVWHDPSPGPGGRQPYFLKYLELHPRTKPNQLTHMSNGMGKALEIEYKSSVDLMLADAATGRPWTSVPPFPIPVVCAFTERDGMGSTYRTQISYRNGYYDAMEREFRGFETAIRTDVGNAAQGAPSLVTEYLFHTGSDVEALKGRPRRVERRESGGAVFDRVASTWQTRQLPLTTAAGESRRVTYCFQQNETTDVLEKGSAGPVQLFREMDWDDYGNQTRLADYGRVEGANRSAWDDERVVTRTYTSAFPSGLQRWILGLTVDETIADENGVPKTKTESYYDDETFAGSNRGVVTKGNLTLQRRSVDVAQNQWIKAARNRYDAFGNVTHTWDPLGDPANPAIGHFRVFTWDAEFHTYPEMEQIELGTTGAVPRLTASATYDRGLGVMLTSTDFNNNNVTSYQFDTFARIAAIIRPGDNPAAPTESYDYKLGMSVAGGRTLNWISAFKRETHGGGTVDSRMFFDGLGRKVMTRSEGETPGQTVVTDTVIFNDRRTEWKKYLPHFDTGGLDWRDPTFQSAFVESNYDAAGRVIQAWQPEVNGYRAFARTTYRPLSRLVEDEEQTRPGSPHFGCGMAYTHDGLKNSDGEPRLRQVEEIVKISDSGEPIASAVAWPTRYGYDILDNLSEIRDSQNNVKPMQYDGLSRMVFMDDLDRGVMRYVYDDASNLRESTDAKGQRIVMTYDGANRIRSEDYLDARGLTPDVVYHYDTAPPVPVGDGTTATPANLAGKLAFVTDLSGAEHSSYDARGRLGWKIKRVPDPENGVLTSYQSRYEYDAMDRMVRLHYPDGDWCDYGYNSRGLTETISGGPGGILTGIDYIATGQMDAIRYGNGVATDYHYDPRQRLRSLVTQHSTLNTQLIHFAYTFDAVSNITRIDDHRPHIPDGDPRENTQVFSYDSLYRITSAEYPTFVNNGPGTISYRYDRIGNMLAQTSNITATGNGLPLVNLGSMSYGGTAGPSGRTGRNGGQPGPHALTGIANPASPVPNRPYPYDANGNMENIDGLVCTWDFKDRLIAVENASMRAEYSYDFNDRRITKRVTPKLGTAELHSAQLTHVLYPDRTYELREHAAPVKYVWNGETRVARITTNLHASERIQRFILHPGWNILALAVTISDGSTQFLSSVAVEEVGRFAPATREYHRLTHGESVPAGTLLRVHAIAATTLAIRGTWSSPATQIIPAGRQWLLNTRFTPIDLTTAIPAPDPLWFFDAPVQSWRVHIPSLPAASTTPATLQPGQALFTATATSYTLAAPDPALDIRYYHQDHLGSSSVMTDATGAIFNESSFYAFGQPRQHHESADAYGFTQKERDQESHLQYFETRFLSRLSTFLSPDMYYIIRPSETIRNPRLLNMYSYVSLNPIRNFDPKGQSSKSVYDKVFDAIDLVEKTDKIAGKMADVATQLQKLETTDVENWEAIDNQITELDNRAQDLRETAEGMAAKELVGTGAKSNKKTEKIYKAFKYANGLTSSSASELKADDTARNWLRNASNNSLGRRPADVPTGFTPVLGGLYHRKSGVWYSGGIDGEPITKNLPNGKVVSLEAKPAVARPSFTPPN